LEGIVRNRHASPQHMGDGPGHPDDYGRCHGLGLTLVARDSRFPGFCVAWTSTSKECGGPWFLLVALSSPSSASTDRLCATACVTFLTKLIDGFSDFAGDPALYHDLSGLILKATIRYFLTLTSMPTCEAILHRECAKMAVGASGCDNTGT
jgi:hypothetical protein